MGTPAARLEVVAGKAQGMSIVVTDELVVGRQSEGAGRLGDDEEISRVHARVALDSSGMVSIEDLGSTNGTFVNGLRLSAPRTLSDGDAIEMGSTTLVVRELPDTAEPTAPAPGPGHAAQPTTTSRAAQPSSGGTEAEATSSPETPAVTTEPVGELPPLSLRLEVDFAAREALVHLGGASEPVRLVLKDGMWRNSPS